MAIVEVRLPLAGGGFWSTHLGTAIITGVLSLVSGRGLIVMDAVYKAVHVTALCLVIGGPLFWICFWRVVNAADMHQATAQVRRRVRYGTYIGACGLLISGYADLLRVGYQVLEPLTLASCWAFLTGTRYGQMTLLKTVCTSFLVGSFAYHSIHYRLWTQITVVLNSVILLTTVSATSHAAAKPGLVPVCMDIIHLMGAVTWGGGLLYLACLPWRAIRQAPETYGRSMRRLLERFATMALVAVCLTGASGAILAFLHVYGLVALADTPYGRFLTAKIACVILALGVAAWQVTRIGPALRRQARALVPAVASALLQHCGRLVRLEAALLLGALCLAALLTTLPPAERPAQVTAQHWTTTLDDWQLHLALSPVGDRGQVQCALTLRHRHDQAVPQTTQLWVHLRMQEHDMGTRREAAIPVAGGHYTAPGAISMAGSWEAEVTLALPQEAVRIATFTFEAATGSLEQGRSRRIDLAAIPFSTLTLFSCVLGGLLSALAGVTLWASRTGKMPPWATPFGCVLLAGGGYLILRVVLVDAYPTTYLPNPLPPTSTTLSQGQAFFQQHCTACHGLAGQGDGPAAAGLNPRPADLTAAHVEDHTDGDLFWWLTHGIPGTAMPAWQEQMTESERWMVIRYLRTLRQHKT
jgi:putative copper export protein/mono/diheme cytochrome c family protein